MKRNVLLVANNSEDSNAIVADAVNRTGRGLRHACNSRRAFELVVAGLDGIDLIIIDLDPGMHSISALEALGCCDKSPPIIVVTGLEEMEMTAIARRHGATACIGKPFSTAELAWLMEKVCPATGTWNACQCDRWGHPGESTQQTSRKCAAGCKGCAPHTSTTLAVVCST